jgi:hypothetical protein
MRTEKAGGPFRNAAEQTRTRTRRLPTLADPTTPPWNQPTARQWHNIAGSTGATAIEVKERRLLDRNQNWEQS